MYPEVTALIGEIRSGKVAGSKTITRRCLNTISEVVDEKDFMLQKENVVMSLLQPGVPLAFNFLRAILKSTSVTHVNKILKFGIKYIDTSKKDVAKTGKDLIRDGDCLMTMAFSQNILEMLMNASDEKDFCIYIAETRPTKLGLRTARVLNESGIKTTLILDSAVNYFMSEVNKVIVGGTAVTQFGLLGKVGTSAMAVCANYNRIPVYSLIEYMKVSDRLIVNEKSGKTISDDFPARVPTHDLTKNSLLTSYITDVGEIEPAKFYEIARQKVERLIK